MTRPDLHLRYPDKLYIGGAWVASHGDERLEIVHPGDGRVAMSVTAAVPADADAAVAAARRAFDHGPWPLLPAEERAALLRRAGRALAARSAEVAAAITLEMGVPITEVEPSTAATANIFEYYARLIEEMPDREERPWGGGRAFVAHRPVGVVAAIVPWNAPLSLAVVKIAPALAAGCTVILKTAPSTPLDALLLAECLDECGFPEGVISILPAGNEVGDMLVRDERIDKVAFTGSTAVGRHIGALAGGRIARQGLELGGKSAAILLDDMDVAEAARRMVPSCMRLTGQACSALTRVLVSRDRQAQFLDAFAAELEKLRPGDPFDRATTLGPIAIERQRDRVEAYIAQGHAEGARLITGGGRPASLDGGFFVEPTLFADVENTMTIAREEIFGPVVSVIAYDDEQQAIRIANDSEYGLYASIFTLDEDAVWRIAPQLRSGNVSRGGLYIDRTLPYGGFKQSGIGREGGVEGLRGFQELQTLYLP